MSEDSEARDDGIELDPMTLDDARTAATLTLGTEDDPMDVDEAMIEDEDKIDELNAASLDETIAEEDI